jgi:ATP-binding cassette subfamily B protein
VRKLSRASQDRVADSSAIAAEVLNAIPVVQSYTAEGREAQRFDTSTTNAFNVAVRRTLARSLLVGFIIIATSAALLWGLYAGTQAVMAGTITAGHLGQTVVYVIILASAFAVLGEVYGDLLRAAGATERLMELLDTHSPIRSPEQPVRVAAATAGTAVRFDAVEFHYPSRPLQPALHKFSMQVAPGETVALVGASGAGKSTVFQLMLRFYDPQQGTIRLGRHTDPRHGAGGPAPAHRHRATGRGDLLDQRPGEHPLWRPVGQRRAGASRRAGCVCRRVHRQTARGLQHLPG